MLVFSGCAGLIYQVTWVRLLGLSLGSTSASVSTVISAFFLGLALGSYLTERITRNTQGSFVPYILVETLIGLFGLISLPILLNLDHLLVLAPAFGTSLTLKFLLSASLLLVPSTCIGATFPIMAAIMVRKEGEIGAKISQLYGFNTLGAVFGASLGGFLIIPTVGLSGSIYLAATLNFLVAMAAMTIWMIVRKDTVSNQVQENDANALSKIPFDLKIFNATLTLILTGFVSIAMQIGWTKYLAIFTGSTIYGFQRFSLFF